MARSLGSIPWYGVMRGIFNSRPPQPKYSSAWNVDRVLDYIRSMGDNRQFKLKDLTHKLATTMALANASCASEIHALNVTTCGQCRPE